MKNKIHKVLKAFSVVNVRKQQVFQAIRKTKDVTDEHYMTGQLLLSATDAFSGAGGVGASAPPKFLT